MRSRSASEDWSDERVHAIGLPVRSVRRSFRNLAVDEVSEMGDRSRFRRLGHRGHELRVLKGYMAPHTRGLDAGRR